MYEWEIPEGNHSHFSWELLSQFQQKYKKKKEIQYFVPMAPTNY